VKGKIPQSQDDPLSFVISISTADCVGCSLP
jgi:hypothetical protein